MIKSILVPATGGAGDDAVFAAALALARSFAADIDFLHVRLDPADVAASLASDVGGGIVSGGLIDRLEQEAAERAEKAKASCRRFCEREGLPLDVQAGAGAAAAHWHCIVGREADWVAEYGRTADLIVAGRPSGNEGLAQDTLEAALLDTGRPLLIAGPGSGSLDTVAIAWKSTREAARAVTAAMPLLASAKRIVVLTVSETGHSQHDSAGRLAETLRRHGLAVEVRSSESGSKGVAETLLDEARQAGAGLLVMGGYGHSRLREMVFGGVTEHVLRVPTLPLLLAH